MSIVNSVKGFVRTVLGIPPLTLPDCVDADSLINYIINGNSIQNGTPTPENPVEVESVGVYDEETGKYKIPVKCSGKNLFDKDAFCNYYNSFNHATRKAKANDNYLGEDCFSYYMCYPSATFSEFMWSEGKFKENTQYIFSGYGTYKYASWESRTVAFLAIRYTDGTTALIQKFFYADRFTRFTYTTAANKTIEYLYIANFSTAVPVYLKDFQIEESTTATEYEPYVEPITTNIYLDEPLRKIGDYVDYIDFESGCVVRNTQKATLTSDKAYLYTTYGNGVRFNNVLQEGGDRYAGLCTHSKDVKLTSVAGGMWCGVNTTTSVYWIGIIDVLGLTTIDEFKEWLDTQSVEVICGKNTDVVEPITLPKLPTIKGTTIYSIDTAIQPSNMSATYYSTAKE